MRLLPPDSFPLAQHHSLVSLRDLGSFSVKLDSLNVLHEQDNIRQDVAVLISRQKSFVVDRLTHRNVKPLAKVRLLDATE